MISIRSAHNQYFYLAVALALLASCAKDVESTSTTTEEEQAVNDPRFELVDVSASGLSFRNDITEDWQNNILTNSYLYNGGGVAIFDANGDGLEDVYLTATMMPNRLFLNRGDLRFEDVTDQAGVAANGGVKTGVSIADVNADGAPDIYVARTGLQATEQRRNLLFINDGTGVFSEQAAAYGLADPSASNHANFFDYDNDGDLDVYVLNHPVEFNRVNSIQAKPVDGGYVRQTAPKTPYDSDRLYENRNGKFVDVTEQRGLLNNAWGLSATASDINGDGYTDLYIANDYIEPDQLLLGSASGEFSDVTDEWLSHMSNHTMGVDIADLNGDARPDVVSLDMLAPELDRGKRLMTTMLQERTNSLKRYGYKDQQMRNAVQINTGSRFSDRAQLLGLDATDWSWTPLIADYNLDGRNDLFVTNGYRRDVSNMDYLTQTVDSVKRTGGLTRARFGTFDKYAELIPTSKLPNYAYAQSADGSFEDVSRAWGLNAPSYSTGAAYGDLDNDGDLDLVVNDVDGPAALYRNTTRDRGEGNFLSVSLTGSKLNPEAIGAVVTIVQGDHREQRELRRTRGFFGAVSSRMVFGLPRGAAVDSLLVEFPEGTQLVQTQLAVNQEVRLSAADSKRAAGTRGRSLAGARSSQASALGLSFEHRENEFEDFAREPLIPTRLSRMGPALAVGDVNGDGLDDVFVGGARDQASALFTQTSRGGFARQSSPVFDRYADREVDNATWFDADGDGDLDLYTVAGGYSLGPGSSAYTDVLFVNEGGVLAKAQVVRSTGQPGSVVVSFDYDDDGDLDLFVGGRAVPGSYPTAATSVVLRNDGAGSFEALGDSEFTELSALGIVHDASLVELNGDSSPELVVVGEWMQPTVFGRTAQGWQNQTSQYQLAPFGYYTDVFATDLDGDGKDDVAIGNLGRNARYSTPLYLYAADFDRNGQLDPILAEERQGNIYTLEKRDPLIKQMPMLKKKFGRYDEYARASIGDVFGSDAIREARQLRIDELQSGAWLSGQGKFVAYGDEAQLAPIYAGVGTEDGAIVAGNDPYAAAETGSLDASDGALVSASGQADRLPFSLDGPVRDLAIVNLANGKRLLVVAVNDAPLEAYLLD